MRKLILQMQISVDGYVARTQPGPEWKLWNWSAPCPWDPALRRDFNRVFAAADTLLLSGRMLDSGYLSHWAGIAAGHPRAQDFAFARRIAGMRTIGFSRSTGQSRWPGAELAGGDLPDVIDELKAQKGKSLLCVGGAGLASALIRANLVDEFQLYVNPVTLHEGVAIFAQRRIDQDLELLGAKAYECGMLVSRYAPRGRA